MAIYFSTSFRKFCSALKVAPFAPYPRNSLTLKNQKSCPSTPNYYSSYNFFEGSFYRNE